MHYLTVVISGGTRKFTKYQETKIRKGLRLNKKYEILGNSITEKVVGKYRKYAKSILGVVYNNVKIYFANDWELIMCGKNKKSMEKIAAQVIDHINMILSSDRKSNHKRLEIDSVKSLVVPKEDNVKTSSNRYHIENVNQMTVGDNTSNTININTAIDQLIKHVKKDTDIDEDTKDDIVGELTHAKSILSGAWNKVKPHLSNIATGLQHAFEGNTPP